MEQTKRYKVSVVTAVYNVAPYLKEMIESIVRQTIGFETIQLILIDDGSQDDSWEICDCYAAKYPANVLVIHKENGGVSSARNEGLKHVRGECINFVDADDFLEPDALEKMYGYLKRNANKIDLVAIPLQYYGSSGTHPLNYKFHKTRIVDLEKQYNNIQLSMSSVLVKYDCIKNRCFDTRLAYAEDAQLLIDILLDKMAYGIVCQTKYWYRKRDSGDSAIDTGRKSSCYYVPYMENFILKSLKNAAAKKGKIPYFVQYTCMYDLQWRIIERPLVEVGILDQKEELYYKQLIIQALQSIEDKIIWEQKNMDNNCKIEVISLKKQQDDSSIRLFYEFIEILPRQILIEGCVKGDLQQCVNAKLILKARNENISLEALWITPLKQEHLRFRFCMERDILPEKAELQAYWHCQNTNILIKHIWFGKFFPLSNQLKSSYLYENGVLLTYCNNLICFSKVAGKRKIVVCEGNFQREMLSKWDRKVFRGWIARTIYQMLKTFKRKELWLISDRLMKADDNGEAFFTYMNTARKNDSIQTYFVLEKSSVDYKRLKTIGNVVSYHSTKHKILSLLCDKKISSQADEYVYNRFFDLSFLYGDIQHKQKFVFLQHGVTINDSSMWLKKTDANISLFVTAAQPEYQSILDYAYGYEEKQITCTGFPRYDYLSASSHKKKEITFMPTWRQYLTCDFDDKTDARKLKKGFSDSAYCSMYRQVFSNSKLFEAADRYHYQIQLMLHPAMPRECISYFHCAEQMKILDRNTRYRKLYADSSLIITDYSSAVFDFAYLRKPVLYYQQDVEEFFSGKHVCRRGYFDYERDGFGEVEYTADALIDRMIEYMKNECQLKDYYRERIDRTFRYSDQNNCQRVYEEIIRL